MFHLSWSLNRPRSFYFISRILHISCLLHLCRIQNHLYDRLEILLCILLRLRSGSFLCRSWDLFYTHPLIYLHLAIMSSHSPLSNLVSISQCIWYPKNIDMCPIHVSDYVAKILNIDRRLRNSSCQSHEISHTRSLPGTKNYHKTSISQSHSSCPGIKYHRQKYDNC